MRNQLIAGLAALLMVGCSETTIQTWPVSGRVVLADGTPVQTGTVEFSTEGGEYTARGSIEKDGSFRLSTFNEGDGAVAGEHLAVVVQLIVTEDLPIHKHDHGPTVDPRFAHYLRSGLQFTVRPDTNNEFEVVVEAVAVPKS